MIETFSYKINISSKYTVLGNLIFMAIIYATAYSMSSDHGTCDSWYIHFDVMMLLSSYDIL